MSHFLSVYIVQFTHLDNIRDVHDIDKILCLQEIAADGERNASHALRDASDTMMQSHCAIQLRYLQVVKYWLFVS